MAIQVLPTVPGAWSGTGAGFASGLSSGLDALADQRLQEVQRREKEERTKQGLMGSGLFTPEQADAMKGLSDRILGTVIKEKMREPGREAYGQALSELMGGTQDQVPDEQPTGQMPLQEILGGAPEAAIAPEIEPQLAPEPMQELPAVERVAPRTPKVDPAKLKKMSPNQIDKILGLDIKLKEQRQKQKEFEHKRKIDERKLKTSENAINWSETRKLREKIDEQADAAESEIARIENMEQLSMTGDMNDPLYVGLMNFFGLDSIDALLKPDTQKYIKFENEFLKEAKSYFGARVTQYEVKQFLKMIPKASNSKEARMFIFKNLKTIARAKSLKQDIKNEIMAENGGVPPLNLGSQIKKRMKVEKDKLYEEFRQGLPGNKVVESGEGMPDPAKYKGKRLRIDGVVYRSDGTRLIREK